MSHAEATASTYATRLFRDESDYALMRGLLARTYPLASPPLNCFLGELDWWRATTSDPHQMSKVRLWFDDAGALVAFVWPRSDQIEVMVCPGHRVVEEPALTLAEAELRSGESLYCWSYEHDRFRNGLLEAFGYRRVDDETLACHRREIADAPASLTVPAGYTVRGFAGESEIRSRVDAHRSAFHPSKMTIEKHRAVMAATTYRQPLDVVCAAADGEIAACTIVWFDEDNALGVFEPVACHADHRRRGLASAVMTEGLRRLHALGGRVAHVMSHREDSAGAATYRRLGFEVIGRLYQWKK